MLLIFPPTKGNKVEKWRQHQGQPRFHFCHFCWYCKVINKFMTNIFSQLHDKLRYIHITCQSFNSFCLFVLAYFVNLHFVVWIQKIVKLLNSMIKYNTVALLAKMHHSHTWNDIKMQLSVILFIYILPVLYLQIIQGDEGIQQTFLLMVPT